MEVTVDPETDQEEVARLIQAADLLALPVVDESGRLLGLITVDDAMNIIQLEEGEDFARVLFDAALAATVAQTLVSICTLATLVGSSMPLVARRFDIDPAVVSAPVVTTLVDAGGLLVYFLIAGAVMAL